MRARFPYLRKNFQWYPVVDVTLHGPRAEITAKALVDSGASFSVFRAEIAGFAMAFSSVSVVTNSLLLRRYVPPMERQVKTKTHQQPQSQYA